MKPGCVMLARHLHVVHTYLQYREITKCKIEKCMYQECVHCPHTVSMLYGCCTLISYVLLHCLSFYGSLNHQSRTIFSPHIVHCRGGPLLGLSGHFFKWDFKYLSTLKGPVGQYSQFYAPFSFASSLHSSLNCWARVLFVPNPSSHSEHLNFFPHAEPYVLHTR